MSDYFLDGLELEPIQQDNTAVKPITIIKPEDKVKKKGEYDPNSPYANIANILKYQAGKTAQIIADNTIVPVVKSAVDVVSNPKKYVEKVKDFAGDVADAYTVGTSGRTDNVKFKEGYGKELMDIANVLPLAAGAKKSITLGAKALTKGPLKNTKFKSEIDWAKWNKEIPDNKDLMEEYNTIEALSKKEGTWMKNIDGSEFTGTPEQFVQMQSKNFKAAFKEWERMYHGSKTDNLQSINLNANRRQGYGEGLYMTDDLEEAQKYAGYFKKEPPKDRTVYELAVDTKDALKFNFNDKDFLAKWNKSNLQSKKEFLEQYRYTHGEEAPEWYLKNAEEYGNVAFKENVPDNMKDLSKNIILDGGYQNKWILGKSRIKSLKYNNGMFDMTNPNIYKALTGVVGTGAIASDKKYRQGGLIGDPPKIKTINGKKFIEKPKEAEAVIDSINENNTPTYRALNPLPTPTVRAYNVPSTKEKFETISNTIADKTKYTAGVYKDLFTGNLDNRIANYVYESVTPIGYDVNTAMQELKAGKRLPFKWDGQKTTFENFDKIDRWKNPETGKLDTYGKYVKEASDDGFNMYLRQKQKYNTFSKSDVKPSISKGEDIDYYKLNYDDDIFDEALYYGANKLNINDTLQIKDSAVGGFNLKNYTLSKGKDDKGTYISYYDKYDLEPTVAGYKIPVSAFMGKPYDIYGRMYYSQEGDNIKRIFSNKKYRLGGIIGDPPNTTPAQESTRVKPIIMTAPDIVNPSDTRMYDIMIKHYPYGSKSGRQRMLPGHIEAVYTTEDGTNLRWPRINSWKSGNEPVSTESNQIIKDKDIRVSYMKINADQFNKFFKEADTYEGEDYNLLTNNCADGICRALNVIPNEKTFGVTNPKYVMDAVNRDPRTYKTINQDKNVGVLQGVYNYLFN